jgi:hypothetical protein
LIFALSRSKMGEGNYDRQFLQFINFNIHARLELSLRLPTSSIQQKELILTYTSLQPNWFKRKQIEKLHRQIAMLQNMDKSLEIKVLVCVGLKILTIAAGFFAGAIFLHVHVGLALAALISLILASVLYFVNRYEYGLFWLAFGIMIIALLASPLGEILQFFTPTFEMPDVKTKNDYKSRRAIKIARAIRKRELRIVKLREDF